MKRRRAAISPVEVTPVLFKISCSSQACCTHSMFRPLSFRMELTLERAVSQATSTRQPLKTHTGPLRPNQVANAGVVIVVCFRSPKTPAWCRRGGGFFLLFSMLKLKYKKCMSRNIFPSYRQLVFFSSYFAFLIYTKSYVQISEAIHVQHFFFFFPSSVNVAKDVRLKET